MFTKLKLKNFRSFDNIELDLRRRDGESKHLTMIYGENGAGKSNLMSGFVLLKELMTTMDMRDVYQELLSKDSIFADENMEKLMRQQIMLGMRDMKAIIDDYRMIGNEETIIAEYEFSIYGNSGSYSVEFSKDEIVHERLEYLLSQRRGIYFDCVPGKIKINSGIVKDNDFLTDIKAAAKRYWGKHSILALVLHELYDKSKSYASNNISENFDDILAEFSMLSCYIGLGTRKWDGLNAPYEIFEKPTRGQIPLLEEKQLDIAEFIFTSFFSAINSDIKKAYYKKTYDENKVKYQLYLEKIVAGENRKIEFSRESTGNHQIVHVLCFLISACMGCTVIIDEVDAGIHDLLFQKVLQEIEPFIEGQVIMTTHNTMLMEAEFAREATYILSEEEMGHKQIRCVSAYEKRLYQKNNIRNKYLNNEYEGLPRTTAIDFKALLKRIEDSIEDNNS